MVHFQDAALACRAVMGAVGFLGLALVAEAQLSRRSLDGKRGVLYLPSFLRRQMTIAILDIQRRSGIGEDGGSIAPVEHEVEEDAQRGRELS